MQQTRQFTKRRPQSPALNQHGSVDGLKVGANKPAPSRSGLAIQSSVPILASQRATGLQETATVQTSQEDSFTHAVEHKHLHDNIQQSYEHQKLGQGHGHDHHNDHHHQHSLQHGHDHHEHNHHHGHNHHEHNHHDHNHQPGHNHLHEHHHHEHDHHGHEQHAHGHNHKHFPQVYTQPLPTYSSIFASLAPSQKALFTCFIGHFLIGIIVWWLGASRESLAIVGFSYLVLFDSFGVLNNFVSSVLYLNPAFSNVSTKRPYGAKRFEIVFALANTIFLLFGTMYTTKESLEHLLLENHHSGDHHGKSPFPFGLLFMLLVAIFASIASNVNLRNHHNLVSLCEKLPQFHQEYSYTDVTGVNGDIVANLKNNIYSLSIVASGLIVFLFNLFNIASSTLDKFLAFGESALMLYLGGTTATALAKVLLQTMPDSVESRVEHCIRQVQQQPNVISVDKVHFWQNSYGKCVGTAEVFARPDANEDELIHSSYNILQSIIPHGGELTISIAKK